MNRRGRHAHVARQRRNLFSALRLRRRHGPAHLVHRLPRHRALACRAVPQFHWRHAPEPLHAPEERALVRAALSGCHPGPPCKTAIVKPGGNAPPALVCRVTGRIRRDDRSARQRAGTRGRCHRRAGAGVSRPPTRLSGSNPSRGRRHASAMRPVSYARPSRAGLSSPSLPSLGKQVCGAKRRRPCLPRTIRLDAPGRATRETHRPASPNGEYAPGDGTATARRVREQRNSKRLSAIRIPSVGKKTGQVPGLV